MGIWNWLLKQALNKFSTLVEIKPGENYLFLLDPEKYDYEDVMALSDDLEKRFPETEFILIHGGALLKIF